jgi:hypothetical protein
MRRYRALLVGNWHYPDDPANLPDLKGPLNDVSRLAEALADPSLGLFAPVDVTTLTERASHEIVAELESFFGEATREDVLLFFYSGHGITADNGTLLLCGRNARTDRKLATTVSSATVNEMIAGCPAAAVVIVLDCCHAGAFKSGDLAGELAGKGRFVLTASRSRDRAPDAEHATGLSRFTGHLLRGLRGEASLAGASHITLSDLDRYVHRKMTEDGPIIPQRRFDGDGEVAIARSLTVSVQTPVPAVATALAPALTLSDELIDVGEVTEGEALPLERVRVNARGPDGAAVAWYAETEATWITLQPYPTHLDLRLTPRAGTTRANVHIRNEVTGDIETIRIVARPVPPRAAPAPERPPQPEVRAVGLPRSLGRTARADLAPAGGQDHRDGRAPVMPDAVPTGPVVLAATTLAQIAATHPVPDLVTHAMVSRLLLSRAERAARKVAGVSDSEGTIGTLDLEGDAYILFTERALYWVNQGNAAAVPYGQFPNRRFSQGSVTSHIDFGDGVPRLIGSRGPALLRFLQALRDRIIAAG